MATKIRTRKVMGKKVTKKELYKFSEKEYDIKKIVKVETLVGAGEEMITEDREMMPIYFLMMIPIVGQMIFLLYLIRRNKEIYYEIKKKDD